MKLVVIVVINAIFIRTAECLCNTCSAVSGLACVGQDRFQVCIDGLPKPPSIMCPAGAVCTPHAQVCGPEGSSGASCTRCRKCDPTGVFACIDYTSFGLCFGAEEIEEFPETYVCPGKLVCNIDSPHICVDRVTTGLGATCPLDETVTEATTTEEPPTTIPNPHHDPAGFCEFRGSKGRFDITSDENCRSYIICQMANDVWSGNLFECPKDTYFSPTKQICGPSLPPRCGGTEEP